MTDPLLPVISKVLGAVLRFGGTGPDYVDGEEFACDAKSIKITPDSSKDGDDVTLACGTVIGAPRKKTYTLNGNIIQRFDEVDRLQAYCFGADGQPVHFWLRFNDGKSPVYQGEVTIERLEEGGDAGSNPGDVAYEFDGVGDYTREPFTPPLADEEVGA
jgi:hypothetical protein